MRAVAIVGGLTAVGLLVAGPRLVVAVALMVGAVFCAYGVHVEMKVRRLDLDEADLAFLYPAPAEDGGSHREEIGSSDAS